MNMGYCSVWEMENYCEISGSHGVSMKITMRSEVLLQVFIKVSEEP
jgi:hypothetical protein